MNAQTPFLLALHRAMNLTPLRWGKLQQAFGGDWAAAWAASEQDLSHSGLDHRTVEGFLANRAKVSPDAEMEALQRCGAQALVLGAEDYPTPLEEIEGAPPLLFVRGEILETDFPAVAVVGSRRLSAYGRRVVEQLITEIARAGVTVVSGLAYGADHAAHQAAVAAGGRTLCVLGNGIDFVYPQDHAGFATRLLADGQGAVVSEYLPGVEVRPENFPMRNRIITGLSRGTIVIEAGEKSGSLISARLANEQGREVFAVPGEIFAPNASGVNQLLLEGVAHPALSGGQVLEMLGLKTTAQTKKAQLAIPKTGIEAEVLKLFESGEKVHIDDLVRRANLPGSAVSSNVMILEIKGILRNLGNQVYTRNV